MATGKYSFLCTTAHKLQKTWYVQVCYDLSNSRTEKRAVDSLVDCADELGSTELVIVTMADERTLRKGEHTISVVPFAKF